MPRVCARQIHRANVPASTPVEYFRKVTTYPFLDELAGQFSQRFSKHQQVAASGLCLLPMPVGSSPAECKEESLKFALAHEEDLPDGQNQSTLKAELDRWHQVVVKLPDSDVPKSIEGAIDLASSALFPCVERLLQLLATWPVSSNSCERSISALRRLKPISEAQCSSNVFVGWHSCVPL